MTWVAVAVGGSAVVGAALGTVNANKANKTAAATAAAGNQLTADRNAAVDAQVAKLTALTPPNLQQYYAPIQQEVAQGTLTPEAAVFKMQQATAQAGITVPQSLLDAQQSALQQIQQVAAQNGMTAVDKASLNNIQTQVNNQNAAQQGAIIQDAQQRGVAGSGLEMAARLGAQQQAANTAAQAGLTVAANAQNARLAAIQQAAQMATTQRDETVAQQQKAAEAQDQINNFNTSFQNSTDAANVAARNAAAATNLANAQAIANNNTTVAAQNAAAQQAAAQQNWTNTFGQATNAANITAGLAGQAATTNAQDQALAQKEQQTAAAQQAAAITQLGSGASSLIDAYGKYKKSTDDDGED